MPLKIFLAKTGKSTRSKSNLDLTADRLTSRVWPNAVEAISLKVEGRNWSSSNGVNSQVIILNQGWNLIGLSIKPDTIDSEKILNLPNSIYPKRFDSVVVAGDHGRARLKYCTCSGGRFFETLGANKLTVSGVDWPLAEGQVLLPYSSQSSPILQIHGRERSIRSSHHRNGDVVFKLPTDQPKLNPTPMAEEPLKIDRAKYFR